MLDQKLTEEKWKCLKEVSAIDLGFPHGFLDGNRYIYSATYDNIENHRIENKRAQGKNPVLLIFSVSWRSGLLSHDHLPCHLHQLMRRAEGPFPHSAQHLRELLQARLAIEPFDAG